MEEEIKQILLKFESDIDNGSGIPNRCIDNIDYDDLIKELVKLFCLPAVSGRSEQLCGTCTEFNIENKMFVCKKCRKQYKTISA